MSPEPSPSRDEAAARFCAGYDPLVTDPMMRAYYRGSGYYNVGLWSGDSPDQASACHALVDRLLAALPHDCRSIADVGCGLGATTARIAARRPAAQVTGTNLSDRQLALAAAAHPGCRFARMDAARMTFPEASLDAVVSVEAAFHFDTRADFFGEALRSLRPGGVLSLSDILFAGRGWAGAWTVPEGNHLAGLEAYRHALASAGFEQIVVEDVTAASWNPWCEGLAAWIGREHQAGRLPAPVHRGWRGMLHDLRHGAVLHYLLASARKPAAGPDTTTPPSGGRAGH